MDQDTVPEPFFSGPEYHTPPGGRRHVFRWVAGLHFYLLFLRLVAMNRRWAVHGRYDRATWAKGSLYALRMIERVGGRVHICGADRLAALNGPVVFAANHMSTLETICLPCIILPYTRLTYVVKESLMNLPGFGPVLRATNPIVVTRDDPRGDLKDVLEQGCAHLAAGTSVCVFPQTTRSTVFHPERFNTLAEKLAARAGVPVMPVALKTDFWGLGRIIKDFGPVHPERDVCFAFGPPMESVRGGPAARALHERVVTFIRDRLAAWESGAFEGGLTGSPCHSEEPASTPERG